MKWTLNQASRETGIAKATILRAITSHRMTAPKNEMDDYEIDPAEFHRVFGDKIAKLKAEAETASEPGTGNEADHPETAGEPGWLQVELKRLSELLKMTDLERIREREKAEDEIRFLRRRLEIADDEREELAKERRTLTAQLLTYQQPLPPPPAPLATPSPAAGPEAAPVAAPAPVGKRRLFGMFRRAG